jgi:hypothetical protein
MFSLTRFYTCLILSAFLCSPLHADSFPRGCEVTGFGYSGTFLLLNGTGEQAFYLIQNRSDSTVELERSDMQDAFMTPPLQATLDPTHWSAFASDVKNLQFQCYKRVEASIQAIDCRDVLDVCQYPRARFALSNKGNYWISTNKDQSGVIQDAVAKGIYLKW